MSSEPFDFEYSLDQILSEFTADTSDPGSVSPAEVKAEVKKVSADAPRVHTTTAGRQQGETAVFRPSSSKKPVSSGRVFESRGKQPVNISPVAEKPRKKAEKEPAQPPQKKEKRRRKTFADLAPRWLVSVTGLLLTLVLLFLVLLCVFWFIMSKTRFGRQIYAVGGNATAAHLSGINVKNVKLIAFMLSGLLASIAGMIHSAQIFQGGPNEGMSYEMYAVAAVAIGGTSMAGGKGTMFGTLVGALIFGMLDNIMGLKGLNSNVQLVAKGFLIILSVFLQAVKKED